MFASAVSYHILGVGLIQDPKYYEVIYRVVNGVCTAFAFTDGKPNQGWMSDSRGLPITSVKADPRVSFYENIDPEYVAQLLSENNPKAVYESNFPDIPFKLVAERNHLSAYLQQAEKRG